MKEKCTNKLKIGTIIWMRCKNYLELMKNQEIQKKKAS